MKLEDKALEAKAASAWNALWSKLYEPGTKLFYDYISSYDHDRRFDHLPTLEELSRQYPNTNGWGTGMEDGVIHGSVALSMICDRSEATGDLSLKRRAADVFDGLASCGSASSSHGLVVRSVSPFDGKSHYIESSRDQYTLFTHALWRYYHSELSSDAERARMRTLMISVCERMERNVVAENGYSFCKEDGTPGLVDRMWEVREPHEAARLPMIYGVTWDMTGAPHWRELYLKYARAALVEAGKVKPETFQYAYGLFQHQLSLEALAGLEGDDLALKEGWLAEMRRIAGGVVGVTGKCHDYRAVDLSEVDMDWRSRELIPAYGESGYGDVFKWPAAFWNGEVTPVREPGEALLIQLMTPGRWLPDGQCELLAKALSQVDYEKAISFSILYPQAAYWRALRNEGARNRMSS